MLRLTKKLNRLKAEMQALAAETLREQEGKSANWIRTRLSRLDWLTAEIAKLEARIK